MKLFRTKENDISEQELIRGCLQGERKMQRLLYERHATAMLRVCLRYACTSFEAEDLLHEAFLKVYRQLHTFKQDCPLEAWIRRIAINTALTHYRKKSRRNELAEIEHRESLADLDVPLEEESAEHLLELVQRLPDKYRLIFNLHAIEDYDYKEISALLDLPEATVRSQYLRARLSLKEMITQAHSYHEKGRN